MEFDIADNGLALKEFVWTRPRTVGRWSSTLLTGNERRWLNVKLKRTAGSPGCDTISKVFDSSVTILDGKSNQVEVCGSS